MSSDLSFDDVIFFGVLFFAIEAALFKFFSEWVKITTIFSKKLRLIFRLRFVSVETSLLKFISVRVEVPFVLT